MGGGGRRWAMNGRRMGDGPPVGTPVVVGAGRWAMGDGRMEIGAAMEDFDVMDVLTLPWPSPD